MDSHSETLVNQGPPAPTGAADTKLPSRISTNSEASETTDVLRSGQGSGRRHPYSSRRGAGVRVAGGRSHGHRRMYSYPGTGSPNQGPIPSGYPQGNYYQGYGAGMRMPSHFGSMDGSEYGGPNPYYAGMPPVPWMGSPWMGGYDWSCQYGMYMMNPVHACRSERSTRIIFVANVETSMDDASVQEAAGKFGTIRGYDSGQRENWSGVFISFYDVRHAEAAVKGLPEVLPGVGPDEQNPCACYFMMPPVGVPGMENQGTIAISDASNEISNQEIKALFAKYGDIRAVWETNPPAPEFRFVEFFDTRCAEVAMVELKSPEIKGCTLRMEFAPFAGLEPVQQAPMHPAYSPQYSMPSPKAAGDPAAAEVGATNGNTYQSGAATQGYQNSPYGWGAYHHGMPQQHHHHPHHSYGGEGYLTPRASAPEPVSEYSRSAEGMWSPQNYMGYGGAYWPYGGQTMMQPMYNEMMGSVRPDGSSSPGRHSNTSDSHNWRPHRTTRTSGDRSYDPTQFEFNLDEACSETQSARTTLMIRNIPNKYSQKMLLDVLNRKYRSCYDFFYLPIDFKNRCNLGYAFVNFTSPAKTAEFYKEFHAKAWEEFNSKKVCEITYARVQGREALVEHFRNSRFPCSDPDYLPLVFDTEEEATSGEGSETKSAESPTAKGTPVHHWTGPQQYSSNPQAAVVAAH
ncbi:hypothetical protein BSKO_02273 [Bryopsis sp. KO-2023]|nr:hypothetical protein BSKO_02273 [Bryopsis sp. KO-2023]